MARTYAEIRDLVEQMLQDPDAAIYDTTETAYWIEDALKEFSYYVPHIVDVIFKIESRTGTDTTGTSGSLTDTTKDQFIATDDDDEKVIHNTTDNTWAVVKTYTDETVLVLTAAIMASGENYAIYNKRCWNNKQIYIGDMPVYLWVDSVEYPIGTRRNFKVYDDVLEIDVNTVADSDLTATILPDIDVLVRFAMPHTLCQLTDLEGILTANENEGDTTIALGLLGATEIIEVGDEFHLENHRMIHIVTAEVTTSGNAADVAFYPPLEAGLTQTDAVYFRRSTLQPQHEELFCHLVAARCILSDTLRHINAIPKGGSDVWRRYQDVGERKLAEVLHKLERFTPVRTSRTYPRD